MTFEQADAQARANQGKRAILLGNGFSMAYDPKRFSFTNLLESAKQKNYITPNSNLDKLFAKLNTCDFEQVIRTLESGTIVGDIYTGITCPQVEQDIKILKKHLVRTVLNNHPEKSSDISLRASRKCAEFLRGFDKIYTLNYDLLSYWVILRNALDFADGFFDPDTSHPYVTYNTTSKENKLFFLHGALHLFDNGTDVIKLTFSRTNTILSTQIYRNLLNNIFPVFISEGTSEAKLDKIHHNYYLSHCLKSLQTTSGTLFLYGTVLKSNDNHIRKAIIDGNFKNVYIGVYSDDDIRVALEFKNEFESKSTDKKPKKAYLYDLKTVNPWK